jgi:hypothetical protein
VVVLAVIIALVMVTVVIVIIAAPLRGRGASGPQPDAEREELEARREAKYREIRDADLDYRMGKLSRADYHAIDAELRREALEILDRLERHGDEGRTPGQGITPRDA